MKKKEPGLHIMGIDPGETTGWAVCNMWLDHIDLISCGEVNGEDLISGGLEMFQPRTKWAPYRAQALALMQIVNEMQPKLVIIEDFTLRQFTTMKKEGIAPARVAAYLDCWLREIMMSHDWRNGSIVWQTPSQIAVISNDRMKEIMPKVYKATAGFPHARDAVRHCEIYRRRRSSKSAS